MIRSLIFSVLLFALCIATITMGSVFTSRILSDLDAKAETANSLSEYKSIERLFEEKESFLSFFIRDTAISEMRYTIKEIIVFTECDSNDEAEGAKSRLCCMIEQQRRLSGLNFQSIF